MWVLWIKHQSPQVCFAYVSTVWVCENGVCKSVSKCKRSRAKEEVHKLSSASCWSAAEQYIIQFCKIHKIMIYYYDGKKNDGAPYSISWYVLKVKWWKDTIKHKYCEKWKAMSWRVTERNVNVYNNIAGTYTRFPWGIQIDLELIPIMWMQPKSWELIWRI